MNGEQMFQKLAKMTKEEREFCHFFWLIDKNNLINAIDDFSFCHFCNLDNYHEKIREILYNEINSADIKDAQKEIEDEMSELLFDDEFFNEFQCNYMNKMYEVFEKILEKKGVKVLED